MANVAFDYTNLVDSTGVSATGSCATCIPGSKKP